MKKRRKESRRRCLYSGCLYGASRKDNYLCYKHRQPIDHETTEIQELTIDTLNNMTPMERSVCLRKYQDWVKKQRKEDRRQNDNFNNRLIRYQLKRHGLCSVCRSPSTSYRCDKCKYYNKIYNKRKNYLYKQIKGEQRDKN